MELGKYGPLIRGLAVCGTVSRLLDTPVRRINAAKNRVLF